MIKLKITRPNGTVVELEIPIDDLTPSAPKSAEPQIVASTTMSAVAIPSEPVRVVEVAKSSDCEPTQIINHVQQTEIEPLAIRGKEVGGEENGGDGRIGGMGERKEVGEEEGRKEENPDLNSGKTNSIYDIQYDCIGGKYCPPPQLINDFISAYGAATVERELHKARAWLTANPQSQKTLRGMGRFLNGWICRSGGMKRQAVARVLKQRDNSLLGDTNESSTGW